MRINAGGHSHPDQGGHGRRGLVILADQGVSSISNFAVGVAVARVAGAAGLGAFSLAYALWLIAGALHRSLVAEPMAIEGDARRATDAGVETGLAAEVLLGLGGATLLAATGVACVLAGRIEFGTAMLAFAPWLPFLVVQDYWRWVGFLTRNPRRALTNDLVFLIVQVAGFALLLPVPHVPAPLVIGLWGLGGVAGAVFGLRQQARRTGIPLRAWRSPHLLPAWLAAGAGLLRGRWRLSRWIAGSSVVKWAASQASVLVVGVVLGAARLGLFQAAVNLATGPAFVLIQAGGSLGLPEATRMLEARGWPGLRAVAGWVTAAGVASVGACTVLVLLVGRVVLGAVYGPGFGRAEPAAVIVGVAYVVNALQLGPILVLKATRNTGRLFGVQLVVLVASLVTATVLSAALGIDGAAWATLATLTVSALTMHLAQRPVARELRAATPATTPSAPAHAAGG
ncbi:MAG TPA: hypothetical protein VFN60_03770 [Acidimicrobiales bacterium]|nr:hypothetical protein [Acidimicrobiales bacterium]